MAHPRCYFVGILFPIFFFFKWLYQRFFTSLSVRPGRWAAILSQLQHNIKTPQTDQIIISYDYGKVWGWFSLPIPIERLEADDGVIFLLGEVLSLDVRIQMVIPPLRTTLTTPAQPCQRCDIWPMWIEISAYSKSIRSSSLVHRGLCFSDLTIMDFPAKMEEINPIKFSWNILQEK